LNTTITFSGSVIADVILLNLKTMDQTWTTFKPDSRYLRVWLLTTSGAFFALATVFTLIDLKGGLLLWCVLPVLTATLFTMLARARFRYNDVAVQQRYFRSFTQNWSDAVAWSYLSTGNRLAVYIRFADGTVLGSTPLLLRRAEIFEMIPILMKNIGEPLRDENIVLPPPPWPFSKLHRSLKATSAG
jgi:uncharacterized membrane protein YbaN (DUF454 family)